MTDIVYKMGNCKSKTEKTVVSFLENVDFDKLWDDFVRDCCEVGPGKFVPYTVIDAAFLTYARLKLATSNLDRTTENHIFMSLSNHLAKHMPTKGITPSIGWKTNNHFVTTALCIGINVISLPQPTIIEPFRPLLDYIV